MHQHRQCVQKHTDTTTLHHLPIFGRWFWLSSGSLMTPFRINSSRLVRIEIFRSISARQKNVLGQSSHRLTMWFFTKFNLNHISAWWTVHIRLREHEREEGQCLRLREKDRMCVCVQVCVCVGVCVCVCEREGSRECASNSFTFFFKSTFETQAALLSRLALY